MSTKSFVWNVEDFLGRGATANVYTGRKKSDGTRVAVKVFNNRAMMRPLEVQDREFDILRQLHHKNIVKMIGTEPEMNTRCPVLVMEYCEGGSLHSCLEEPQNAHGLQEEEFVRCMCHIVAGLKHLHEQAIVHRDVKPGNILRAFDEDGQTIYKLTDFGGAKELAEGELFQSLIGTEEYLHPAVYERAVIRPSTPHATKFPAEVDLWSMGVTLYQAATGNLPFRPFMGRRDTAGMHHITTKKASKVISGIQRERDGAIEFSKELPDTCSLSPCLKKYLTPIIAGLVEYNVKEMTTFNEFFADANEIAERRRVYLFNVRCMEHMILYMKPTDSIKQLKETIQEYTGVAPDNQRLFYQQDRLDTVESGVNTINDITPLTSASSPIMLVSCCAGDAPPQFNIPAYLTVPRQHNTEDINQFLDFCRDVIIVLHDTANLISDHELGIRHMNSSLIGLRRYIQQEVPHFRSTLDLIAILQEDLKKKKAQYKESQDLNEVLESCEKLKKEFGDLLNVKLGDTWHGSEAIASMEQDRMVAKIQSKQKEAIQIYDDVYQVTRSRAYLTASKKTTNKYRSMRLVTLAQDSLSMLQKFRSSVIRTCMDQAQKTLNGIMPTMIKMESLSQGAVCCKLLSDYIQLLNKQLPQRSPETTLLLSGSPKTAVDLTGSTVSSDACNQKSHIAHPPQTSAQQIDNLVTSLKKLTKLNEELLEPMKENLTMVRRVKQLVGEQSAADSWVPLTSE